MRHDPTTWGSRTESYFWRLVLVASLMYSLVSALHIYHAYDHYVDESRRNFELATQRYREYCLDDAKVIQLQMVDMCRTWERGAQSNYRFEAWIRVLDQWTIWTAVVGYQGLAHGSDYLDPDVGAAHRHDDHHPPGDDQSSSSSIWNWPSRLSTSIGDLIVWYLVPVVLLTLASLGAVWSVSKRMYGWLWSSSKQNRDHSSPPPTTRRRRSRPRPNDFQSPA